MYDFWPLTLCMIPFFFSHARTLPLSIIESERPLPLCVNDTLSVFFDNLFLRNKRFSKFLWIRPQTRRFVFRASLKVPQFLNWRTALYYLSGRYYNYWNGWNQFDCQIGLFLHGKIFGWWKKRRKKHTDNDKLLRMLTRFNYFCVTSNIDSHKMLSWLNWCLCSQRIQQDLEERSLCRKKSKEMSETGCWTTLLKDPSKVITCVRGVGWLLTPPPRVGAPHPPQK